MISHDEFIDLLYASCEKLRKKLNSGNRINSTMFEKLTFDCMAEVAKEMGIDEPEYKGGHIFPDIILGPYGVEVKTTEGDKWDSLGNSIRETTRAYGVEEIFIIFGKLGGTKEVKYRKYEECLSEVVVTHSPRYSINMNLKEDENIFAKMGTTYDKFRKNPIKNTKDYYRAHLKNGEELWWLDEESAAFPPILKILNEMDKELQDTIIAKGMLLFPEVFDKKRTKFRQFALYLAENQIYTTNLRDYFSSKGRVTLRLDKNSISIPRILLNCMKYAPAIHKEFTEIDKQELVDKWKTYTQKKICTIKDIKENPEKSWKAIIDYVCKEEAILAHELYEFGIKNNGNVSAFIVK